MLAFVGADGLRLHIFRFKAVLSVTGTFNCLYPFRLSMGFPALYALQASSKLSSFVMAALSPLLVFAFSGFSNAFLRAFALCPLSRFALD